MCATTTRGKPSTVSLYPNATRRHTRPPGAKPSRMRVCGTALIFEPDSMRLYLQAMTATAEAPRYAQITLEQDLLGGWTLYRESGVQGGKATLKREQFLERDDALAAFEKARDAQIKRGFRVMFSQGLDGPYGP